MSNSEFDVLVVGGGPAGSATAALLACSGYRVVVLEKARFPREKPCAEYFSPGTLDVLQRLGALEAVLALEPARPQGMRIHSGSNTFHQSYVDSMRPETNSRAAIGVPRPLFDQALLDHTRASGAEVRERAHVQGLIVERGRVVGVRAHSPDGDTNFKAKFVVGADGIHSTVAYGLRLNTQVRWPRRLGLIARYRGLSRIDMFGEMHVGNGWYCGLAPLPDNTVNVGLVEKLGMKPKGETTATYFERRLAEIPEVASALAGMQRITPIRGVGPLVHRVWRVAGPGYLLVGDAAGFFDPFTGEGVYRALRGAELAADAIAQALGDGADRPIGYEISRQAAFGDKERVCLLIQLVLQTPRLFNYVIDRLSQRQESASILSSVLGDYAPASSALRPGYLWSLLRP